MTTVDFAANVAPAAVVYKGYVFFNNEMKKWDAGLTVKEVLKKMQTAGYLGANKVGISIIQSANGGTGLWTSYTDNVDVNGTFTSLGIAVADGTNPVKALKVEELIKGA